MIKQKDLDKVKRSVLRKYAIAVGPALEGVNIRLSEEISTACVVGERDEEGVLQVKEMLVNPKFFEKLTFAERVFVLAHEAFHIAFKHFRRSMDMPEKDAERRYQEYCAKETDPAKRERMKIYYQQRYHELWNIATDACINAFLKRDGLSFPENVTDDAGRKMTFVDMEEGLSKSAEKIYTLLVQKAEEKEQEEEKKQDESQTSNQNNNDSGKSSESNSQSRGSGSGESSESSEDKSQSGGSGDSSESSEDKSQSGGSGSGESSESSDGKGQPSNSGSPSSSMGNGSNSQGQSSPSKGGSQSQSGGSGMGGSSIDDLLSDDYVGIDSHEEWNGSSKSHSKSNSQSTSTGNTSQSDADSTSNADGEETLGSNSNSDSHSDGKTKTSPNGSNPSAYSPTETIDEGEVFDKIQRGREQEDEIEEPVTRALSRIRTDAGIVDTMNASPVLPWKSLLIGYLEKSEEVWGHRRSSRYNPNPRLEDRPIEEAPEIEIILDTSGSISAELLRGFLLQLVPIFKAVMGDDISIKVGCFGDGFSGFTVIRSLKDIKDFQPVIGGGTNYEAAARSFTPDPGRRITKIVFTDGTGGTPQRTKVENLIWIIFGGGKDLKPISGRIIRVSDKDYASMMASGQQLINIPTDEDEDTSSIGKRR